MNCKKCGQEMEENTKVCSNCGFDMKAEQASQSDSVVATKKSKRGSVIIISVTVAAVILVGFFLYMVVFGGVDRSRISRLCNLGDRYLSEMDYEQAVASYQEAIEIDPKSEDAYKGLADAYIGLGDYESAKEALEKGIEETDSVSLVEYLTQIEVKLQEIAESQSSLQTESESQSQSESESHSESQSYLQEILVQGVMLESYGNAYGGVMPVKMNGRWGAVDYENNVIVPCEYDGFYSPNKLGNAVFYNTIIGENEYGEYEEYEYYLFDKQGTLIYQGMDEVRASGGMYITLGEYYKTYYRLDGTVVFSQEINTPEGYYPYDVINTFYDGISSLSAPPELDVISGRLDESGEGNEMAHIGTVDMQGNVLWREDTCYILWQEERARREAEERERQEAAAAQPSTGCGSSGAAGVFYIYESVISTMNHGYYIRYCLWLVGWDLTIYDEHDNHVATISYKDMSVDENDRVHIGDLDTWNMENNYRGFYVDGGYIWNYGPHMVFSVDGKDVLVDFSNNTGDAEILDSDEIVTAVYDYISMADEKYWLVQSGDQWGYIDHDGNEMAMFEDASGFVNGYALVIEDGEAWLINEEFERLENLGQADSVSSVGELYRISVGDETHFYQFD